MVNEKRYKKLFTDLFCLPPTVDDGGTDEQKRREFNHSDVLPAWAVGL